jgi:predicted acetyltransferase
VQLTLELPAPQWEREFADLAREMAASGDERYLRWLADFPAYLARLREDGEADVPGRREGVVPQTTFWLAGDGRRLLGISRLRHHLTPGLMVEGGHIGYQIRPSERRKGYGTALLRLTLGRAAARGLARARVTCDADNVGSIRVIENNGGVLDGEALSVERGVPMRQYWVPIGR